MNREIHSNHLKIYLFVFMGLCIVIASALGFQYIGGYQPCKLCLEQREPWYFAIPFSGLAVLSLWFRWPAFISRGLLAIAGLAMLFSLVLAIRHSGVEWQWWEGPGDCGAVEGGIAGNAGDLLNQLQSVVPPSCDAAALRFLGLSFAGWNGVASLVLAVIALKTVFTRAS